MLDKIAEYAGGSRERRQKHKTAARANALGLIANPGPWNVERITHAFLRDVDRGAFSPNRERRSLFPDVPVQAFGETDPFVKAKAHKVF